MSLLLSLQPMKKFLFLSIIVCFFSALSFAQYIVKPANSSTKADTTSIALKKTSETLPMTGATAKPVAEKSTAMTTEEEEDDDFDEKELNELEASITKAKAALGLKNVSTTTSSKSVPSKNKEVTHKVEEPKTVLAAPTTTYEAPTLMINGRAASESNRPKTEFKTAILTEEEKKFYNEGGLKVNLTDEIERDSIYVSPTIPPSFVGGVDAMKAFFAQNLKVPEVLKGQEIKGRVFIRFIVRKDGKVDKVHLVKGPNDDCNSEAIRVIKMMPAWTPASDRGDAVSSYHVLPISFSTAAPIKK
jgi:TonB family protein